MANSTPARSTHLVRDRETYRYLDLSYIHAYIRTTADPIPSARPSPDSTLTAFAQLAVHRLGVRRAFVSLLDRRMQYVIAETTASAGLRSVVHEDTKEGLIMCGVAFPYEQGLSAHVLEVVSEGLKAVPAGSETSWRPPVVIIPDVQADSRFASSRILAAFPDVRFYAAVPIRSPAGPLIGVLSLSDDRPRQDLGKSQECFLSDMSLTVMEHLKMIHHRQEEARGKRMMRGLGSFIEGSTTMSSLTLDHSHGESANDAGTEGMLNVVQQAKMHHLGSQTQQANGVPETQPLSSAPTVRRPSYRGVAVSMQSQASSSSDSPSGSVKAESTSENELNDAETPLTPSSDDGSSIDPHEKARAVFSRAANIIRESVEVEGVLFFDANIATAGALGISSNREVSAPENSHSPSHLSSEDEGMQSVSSDSDVASDRRRLCDILGFSTTETSSINGHTPHTTLLRVPERFLRLLLRRYPNGKIFNFDENGAALSDTESESDQNIPATDIIAAGNSGQIMPHPHRQQSFSRSQEPSFIIKTFPGARSLITFPLWDSHRLRWYAGGVAWTRTPTRVFGVKSELSYLRAFGAIIMTEIAKLDAQQADQAKAHVLGSISHELRSPLHGILGSVDLMQETDLDVFQDSTVHTIERCGITLLDTIDHLLDYAKVNDHLRSSRAPERKRSSRHKAKSLTGMERRSTGVITDVHVDLLVEEVVESMFAATEFQTSGRMQHVMSAGRECTDQVDTLEGQTAPIFEKSKQGRVKIILDIRPAPSWKFSVEVGALRRIVMNIFGNALKYTTEGHVRVTLSQEERPKGGRRLKNLILVVEDSGRGISKEFLAHHLFTPFMQEDPMVPGTGLGLSIIQKILKSLGGTIHAQSKPGHGTTVSVSLPLSQCAENSGPEKHDAFAATVRRTRGLRVCFHGFDQSTPVDLPDATSQIDDWQLPRTSIAQLCQHWLDMDISLSTETVVNPDVYVATLAGAQALTKLNQAGDVFQPVVVICPSAGVARQLSTTSKTLDSNGVFEYIAQPCGPRKLAKAFTLALDRWATVQIERATKAANSQSPEPIASRPDVKLHRETVVPPRSPAPTSPLAPGLRSCWPYLVVDDSAINVKLLSTYLQRQNLPVVSATDGVLGVAAFKNARGSFSCIFMDVQMPNLDGIGATRAIREYERREGLQPVYIVMLSGLAMTDVIQEAEASGANEFFPKPVRLRALNPIIAKSRRMSWLSLSSK